MDADRNDRWTDHGLSPTGALPADTSVRMFLKPFVPYLDQPGVEEVCLNQPGELFIEDSTGWRREAAPDLTQRQLQLLARAVATFTGQDVGEEHPLLSATLPQGERIQIVLPPAAQAISVSIRKPSSRVWRLQELTDQGLFAPAMARAKDEVDRRLLDLLKRGEISAFLQAAVAAHLTIVISGATGSGKTTLMKALIQECDPQERLITIEDVREIVLPRNPNAVHLLYSHGNQGTARVTARDLLVASLRMRPDRILMAEIREGECYEFLRNAASGHPGSLTSVHAGSCAQAFEQMALMVRQSPAGAGLTHGEARHMLTQLVDVVVQTTHDGHVRRANEIWYRAAHAKLGASV